MSEPAAAPRPVSSPSADDQLRARVAGLEREAKALGNDPRAALLFYEAGLLWERLKNPRNAAVAYQASYKVSPRFVANLRAARKLFGEVGNWQMVTQLLDAEVAASTDRRVQAALLFEKAQILEQRLTRDEESNRALQACLDLAPADLSLLVQLEALFVEKNDHASLVRVYQLMAEQVADDVSRAQYLLSAALLLDDRLRKPEEAASLLRRAFAIERRDPVLLSAMRRLAQRENKPEELLAVLAAEAELAGPNAGPTHLEIAKVYERQGRREDALASLLAARRINPSDALVLSALAQHYEADGRYEDLSDILLSWLDSLADQAERVAINLRLAGLYEEHLKRDDEAALRYRAVLELDPAHATALGALGKLYHRNARWEDLIWVYEAELAVATEPKQKVGKAFKVGELLEQQLGRVEDAILRYQECLKLQPGHLPAQKALLRLFERQSRFAELVTMYEQDLLQTTDKEQAIATLNKIASLYEERLSDVDHAVDALKRILEIAPDHLPTIHNLARLYERGGRWAELIQSNETEATLSGDTKQILSLHHRNAEILEEQLGDRAGAIAAYERVLSLSPSYLPALKALGRLYAQESRWNDLARMYRAEAEIAPSTEQAAALIYKIGELAEQRLKDDAQALASYQEVLTLAPSYFPAMRALARLYRAQGAWESLIEVLRAEAANRIDPLERANALYQAAAIWEDVLDRKDRAIEGYQEVLRLTPGHPSAVRALERLFMAQGNVRDLIAELDRETQVGPLPSRVAAFSKLARLYLDRLSEPARAAQCCESLLALEPGHLGALVMLERIRSADRARRAETRARLAGAVSDGRLRSALQLAAEAEKGGASFRTQLQRAYLDQPADEADALVGLKLESALDQARDDETLLKLYEHRLHVTEAAPERVELYARIAELHERHARFDVAAQCHEKALELMPNLLTSLQGARRAWSQANQPARAHALLLQEADAAKDTGLAVEALLEAARIARDALQNTDAAISAYRRALEKDPLHAGASQGLEELLASQGGTTDLADLHLRRAAAKQAQKDLDAAADEWVLAARVYMKLGDPAQATRAVTQALASRATHPEALEVKADLAAGANQWAEVAAALAVRVQQGGEAKRLSGLHLKLGSIYQDHLSDVTRATAHLQTALAADPGNLDALERLAAIHTFSRNWTGATDALKQLLELEARPDRLAQHTLAFARVVDEGLGDAPQAAALYQRALQLAPGDAAVTARLVQLYERTGNLPELVKALEDQAAIQKDSKGAVVVWLKIGEISGGPLAQPAKAIAAYRRALEIDPTCVPARAALAELFDRDTASRGEALAQHRAILRINPGHGDSVRALLHLFQSNGSLDAAFCAAAVMQFLQETGSNEQALYEELKAKVPAETQQRLAPGDWTHLLHPAVPQPVLELFMAVGDQLSKIHPPQLEGLGVDRKADRLKPDHAIAKALRAATAVLSVEEYELYQSKRGWVTLEATEPLSVCVSQETVRRFQAREQRFLFGRAAFGLWSKTAIARRLSTQELASLLGNSVRIHFGSYAGLGQRNDEISKQLRRAYSRKAIKALEGPSSAIASGPPIDLKAALDGLAFTADRVGLLLAGDPAVALGALVREELAGAGQPTQLPAALSRPDVRELVDFALSDAFFALRKKLGFAVGG